ncbi:MAG: glycoside hydrolase family 2 TIM barrel-domain containing protein [Mobilitalea sp.]
MKSFLLNNWKFHYNDCPEAWYKGYLDNTWEEVSVPHDWSVHMPFSKEYSSGTGYLAGGIGWYRTNFFLPESLKGKRIYITFDGIYKNSQVWCNSYYLGKRPFGYSTFRYDITEQASFGTVANLIAVKVDHSDIADSRWFTGSGITRKVTITIEEPVHSDFNGIFFQTLAVTEEKADIKVANTIVNDTLKDVNVTVENILSFDNNELVCLKSSYLLSSSSTSIIDTEGSLLSSGSTRIIDTEGSLLSPALWSPETPNLYQLTTIIRTQAVDNSFCYTEENVQLVGIRSIHFHSDHGFFLNDKPYKIKGVCIHHDAGCLGAAVLPEVWSRRLLLLKEMGCNALRMSHNPHMPELYDLCDSFGFLVIDEAFDEWEGVKNKWSTGHNVYPPKHQGYYEDFPEWHERDLSDLVKRDRNHPSIIAWSIGNEIDYPNDPYCHPLFTSMIGNNDKNKPDSEKLFNQYKPNAERLTVIAAELVNIVKKHDTTRPVTAAVAFPELSTQIGFIDSYDIVGYNYKEQHYAEDHLRFPDKPFFGSENSPSLQAWKAVRDCEYISGQFLWTGIDYLGEAHGWPVHGSGAGILNLAGFPKVSYYRRKSFWADSPMLYLATARANIDTCGDLFEETEEEWKPMYRSWNYLPGEIIEIRCYTNLPSVHLLCNGKSLDIQSYDDAKGSITWLVPFEPGEITATGSSQSIGNKDLTKDTLISTGTACNIILKLWNLQEATKKSFPAADSATNTKIEALDSTVSLKQIEVTITDGSGNWITSDSTMLSVKVSGSSKLIGLENGDLSDNTEYSAEYRRAFEGRLLIYVADSEPFVATTITVSGAGLKTAILEY